MTKIYTHLLCLVVLLMSAITVGAQTLDPFKGLTSPAITSKTFTKSDLNIFGDRFETSKPAKSITARMFSSNNGIVVSGFGEKSSLSYFWDLPAASTSETVLAYGFAASAITTEARTYSRTLAISEEHYKPIYKIVIHYFTPRYPNSSYLEGPADASVTKRRERLSTFGEWDAYRDTIVLNYPMRVVPLQVTGAEVSYDDCYALRYAQYYSYDGSRNARYGSGNVALLYSISIYTREDAGTATEKNTAEIFESYNKKYVDNNNSQEALTYYSNRFSLLQKDASNLRSHYDMTSVADVNEDGKVNSTDVVSIYNRIINGKTNIYNGQKYVDLGLPSGTLWAAYNVGAQSPEGYGDYFAWGESNSSYYYLKNKFTEDNYKPATAVWSISSGELPIQYTPLGGLYASEWKGWTLPSEKDLTELAVYTTITEATVNGVKGVVATSKVNSNSIFFPYNGSFRNASHYNATKDVLMWTTTASRLTAPCIFTQGTHGRFVTCYYPTGNSAYYGMGWRAVYKPSK